MISWQRVCVFASLLSIYYPDLFHTLEISQTRGHTLDQVSPSPVPALDICRALRSAIPYSLVNILEYVTELK